MQNFKDKNTEKDFTEIKQEELDLKTVNNDNLSTCDTDSHFVCPKCGHIVDTKTTNNDNLPLCDAGSCFVCPNCGHMVDIHLALKGCPPPDKGKP